MDVCHQLIFMCWL